MKDKNKENCQENPDTVSQQVPVNEAADKVVEKDSVVPEPAAADVKDEKEEKIAELNDRYLRLAAE
ncbi:MAG TPA: hypothetical protein P5523_05975, partial [Bacteroidales bacterium]|nr:hypothetical protein [Bacteroidales bacterium]